MPNIEDNAFKLAKYFLENPHKTQQIEIRDSLHFSDIDFRLALRFLIDGEFCKTAGQFGKGIIWQKNLAKLQDFVNRMDKKPIPLATNTDRLYELMSKTLKDMGEEKYMGKNANAQDISHSIPARKQSIITNRLIRVFLCHASNDKPAVYELYKALKLQDWIDPWLDKMKILPGQNWRIVIEEAVEASDVVIICISYHSANKEGFVQKEMKYAYDVAFEKPEGMIFLIPLRLEECDVPRRMRHLQWVDYFGAEKEEHYSNLLEALKLRHEQKIRTSS